MTREIIASILESEGAESRAGVFKIPETRDATCFVSAPGELLGIPRVVRVELKELHLTIATAKEDRFSFAYQDILGFKLAALATAKDRSAGFAR